MTLAKDIKQTKPFSSPFQEVLVNIIYTSNWINLNQNSLMKKYDLSSQQFNVLRILKGKHPEPMTVNAIIERMLDKMSNASRLVDKLLIKELVYRTESKNDRRACDVGISEKGIKILEEIKKEFDINDKNITNISEEEAKALSTLLDKFRGSEPEQL
jgi:DNA-binding MarR family transcriptional regulator